jgi:hypothetical protein
VHAKPFAICKDDADKKRVEEGKKEFMPSQFLSDTTSYTM